MGCLHAIESCFRDVKQTRSILLSREQNLGRVDMLINLGLGDTAVLYVCVLFLSFFVPPFLFFFCTNIN